MSIFSEEWRDCLREQYKYVIRSQDQVTRESLTAVMGQVGFTGEELAQLRLEATMHIEDVPDDFVPDLNILDSENPPSMPESNSIMPEFEPHPLECQCPACIEINAVPHDEDGQPITPEDDEEDPDSPQQMTMF